ncbi:hypothetical protein [Mycolicibacterium sp. 050158]|uniref:hypothetical protein n=1 Tax=Mycolicibacterium sp. 050158 TaxID=3090602 RepID=UPI00299E2063|nr:hypothetical protein [Mycolicibacterium sp. 050158]MDX1889299.1 hypothetical protein [Mycolicibacterium sp. 050158]
MRTDYEAFFAELERRNAYMLALPGERLREDMEAMKRCLYTFGRNEVELSSHVDKFVHSETQAPDVDGVYVDELVRLLHNFLTSVTTYIDSQRVVMRHRWPTKDGPSEFEASVYTPKRRDIFETGEAEFMTKLRNYCTHYSIPVPGLSTSISWDESRHVQQANKLQLDRDALLRWTGWDGPATKFLEAQPEQFDFPPIIASYVKATQAFFGWFWDAISRHSAALVEDRNFKAAEIRLWIEEYEPPTPLLAGTTDLVNTGGGVQRLRAERRARRYAHGTQGFRISTVDASGNIVVGSTDWASLPP